MYSHNTLIIKKHKNMFINGKIKYQTRLLPLSEDILIVES